MTLLDTRIIPDRVSFSRLSRFRGRYLEEGMIIKKIFYGGLRLGGFYRRIEKEKKKNDEFFSEQVPSSVINK